MKLYAFYLCRFTTLVAVVAVLTEHLKYNSWQEALLLSIGAAAWTVGDLLAKEL